MAEPVARQFSEKAIFIVNTAQDARPKRTSKGKIHLGIKEGSMQEHVMVDLLFAIDKCGYEFEIKDRFHMIVHKNYTFISLRLFKRGLTSYMAEFKSITSTTDMPSDKLVIRGLEKIRPYFCYAFPVIGKETPSLLDRGEPVGAAQYEWPAGSNLPEKQVQEDCSEFAEAAQYEWPAGSNLPEEQVQEDCSEFATILHLEQVEVFPKPLGTDPEQFSEMYPRHNLMTFFKMCSAIIAQLER